jgi:3-oxoacyl-(acyl-carrier-protein) synthase
MHVTMMGILRRRPVLGMLQAISCLEMHGTGTPLGDPIEVGAASAVLQGAAQACPEGLHVLCSLLSSSVMPASAEALC